jgi:NAD(P)H-nitrite reductase large subunit
MLIPTFCSQRIDMFGAQKADLPSIWAELVEAGFQSGHAYGKSLRTVKSCVGTTWCRYGVGDSVGRGLPSFFFVGEYRQCGAPELPFPT